jgi:hypothetical protein
VSSRKSTINSLLLSLQERAKELECFYAVQDILAVSEEPVETICNRLLKVIPPGWQHPDLCKARILIGTASYASPDYVETPWILSADIVLQERVVGCVSVCYTMQVEKETANQFLPEEERLLQAIADRLEHYLRHRLDRQLFKGWNSAPRQMPRHERADWQIALDTINHANPDLYRNLSRKMLNYLCWSGVREAEHLLRSFHPSTLHFEIDEYRGDWNTPREGHNFGFTAILAARVFNMAAEHLDGDQIMVLIQKWVREDKQSFLIQLVNTNLPTSTVSDVIRRYHELSQDQDFVPIARTRGILISLIRRFLSGHRSYTDVAKELITINDFHELLQKTIHSAESHGQLGGKAGGLYLAWQIVRKKSEENETLKDVRTPKTWVITSDVLYHFVHHCNFDELVDQKYKPIQQVRLEYPAISQAFKSVTFPADIVRGLSVALDDFGTHPIIVRSSSLLEDSVGAAFSGKYRSLFLANQGSKRRRLEALTDAVAEVYASTFGPDPIEYRSDRGLLDYNEEMGILIQEVVGQKVGKYFLPAYAGVAFGRNDYRWSPRIRRNDGLVRMVPGLGTRAVDRTSNDYPILFSPGQPALRPNAAPSEMFHYSPREIDVIDLESETFQTLPIDDFLSEIDYKYPQLGQVFSAHQKNHIRPIGFSGLNRDLEQPVATFNGLINQGKFVNLTKTLLATLEETLGYPVDIEFASDGEHLYLLQCRAQSSTVEGPPVPLPKGIQNDRILFTAMRHIPNGYVSDISYVVYVDPAQYSELTERAQMVEVAEIISRLNAILPRRSFILMGPGRWGSRGDIKLGVSVEYSGINNTAMLIEIARAKGNYVPELSFGTHFFQDLVETQIRYLPLYPDQDRTVFNESFLCRSPNLLPVLLPEHEHLADTVRVVNVTPPQPKVWSCVWR